MGKWKKRGARKGARRWRIKALINRHGGKCPSCGDNVCLTHLHPKQASIDHIIPRSRGGSDSFDNLRLLCRSCNEAKGSTVIDEDGEVALEKG